MNALRDILIGVFSLGGAVVVLISMIGLLRLPDALCRSHALGKGMTLGISLLMVGLWLSLGAELAGTKVMAAVFFQFLTIPVASHLLARVAVERGYPRHGPVQVDEDCADRRPPGTR